MSREFMYRHHEEPHLKFYDPFLIPLKYVDAMRRTQTSVNNVSEHNVNDLWTETKGVTPSEKWTGTTRCQILRTRLSEGHHYQRNKSKIYCRMGRRKCQTARSTPQQRNLRSIDRWQRWLQGDCWRSSETGKRCCSSFAVHWEGWQPRRTSGSCNFNWCQWGAVRFRKIQALARKWSDNIRTTSPKKCVWEAFTVAWYTRQFLFKKLWRYQKPEQPWIQNGINQRQFQFGMSIKWDQSRKSSVRVRRMKKQFSSLMWLKNAELTKHVQKCKERDVLREDNAKDEEGIQSSVHRARVLRRLRWQRRISLDTLSKLLGMTGQTSDAISAYTRVKMTEASRLFRLVYTTVCHLQVTCENQKSTPGGLLCVLGSHTFFPISCMCKRSKPQFLTAVQSQKLCRLTGSRMNGSPALQFWECVLETFKPAVGDFERHMRERVIPSHSHSDNCLYESIDHAPPNIPNSSHSTQLDLLEDNAAVIQIVNKGRSPNLRHVTRTHRVDFLCFSASEFGSFYFDKIRANQRSSGGYFDKGTVDHDAMAFFVDFAAIQTTLWIKWSPQLLSQTFLLLSLRRAPKRCLRWWHNPRTLTRYRVSIRVKCCNQAALWIITWHWSNWAIVSSIVHKTRGMFLQKAEDILLQVDTSSQILRKQLIVDTISPFDWEVSTMHEAEVHVFSDSVLCRETQAMTSQKSNSPKEGTTISSNRENLQGRSWWINDPVHIPYSSWQKNDFVLEMDEWIRQGQGEVGQRCPPENLSSSSSIDGIDERNSDFFTGTERR